MDIYEYRLQDFSYSEKAVWIYAKWCEPELRIPASYKNIFIPISQCAVKRNSIFIPKWLKDKICDDHFGDPYKFAFPNPIKTYRVKKDKWVEFKEANPFTIENTTNWGL